MLTYRATIPLSRRSLTHLADLLRAHRARRGTRYRRLDPGRQALLVLAHLRNGDTPARLAGGFHISATTAWRYIREAVDLLAATAPTLVRPNSARPLITVISPRVRCRDSGQDIRAPARVNAP